MRIIRRLLGNIVHRASLPESERNERVVINRISISVSTPTTFRACERSIHHRCGCARSFSIDGRKQKAISIWMKKLDETSSLRAADSSLTLFYCFRHFPLEISREFSHQRALRQAQTKPKASVTFSMSSGRREMSSKIANRQIIVLEKLCKLSAEKIIKETNKQLSIKLRHLFKTSKRMLSEVGECQTAILRFTDQVVRNSVET